MSGPKASTNRRRTIDLSAPAVDVKLLVRAGNALIAWRRNWERTQVQEPCLSNGQDRYDLRIWRLAGKLMRAVGEEPKLP